MRLKMNVAQPCITVVSHITSDVTQPALYLTAKNGQKYLIGRVGEGLQRSMTERKFKTFKFSGVFLTGENSWPSVSGLPGLLLSFGERGVDVSKLYTGPGKLLERATRLINSWSHFKFHRSLQTKATSDTYSDENLTMRPVVVDDSTSFVIQMKPTRGKFMVEKARALGVPPGVMFGKLSGGEPVQLPDSGKWVQPSDVVGPSPVPARVLVLDLPSMNHVRSLLQTNMDELLSQCKQSPDGYDLRAIYYFFQDDVDLQSPEVHQLISGLGQVNDGSSFTRNYISHPLLSPNYNTLVDFGEFQKTFRNEFPDHFTQLVSQPAKQQLPASLVNLNCYIIQQMHTLSIAAKDISGSNGNSKKRAKHTQIESEPSDMDLTECDATPVTPAENLSEPQVVTLGTGASAPSKYRNVAGTLVRSPLFGSIIFDAGEATYNFMTRLFGRSGSAQILRELKVVYISHMHADHHLGALRLIRSWIDLCKMENFSEKLIIACPGPFIKFIRDWAIIDEFQSDVDEYLHLLDLDSVCIGDRYTSKEPISSTHIDQVAISLGIRIVTCTAHHNCHHSYNGTISTLGNEFKVSYSGDTKPNRFFARTVGQGSDLLIHEATHENELEQTAALKGHSTIGGALEIAKLMNAKNTVLTHISQRYPKLPTIGTAGATIDNNQHACFGFDGMRADLSQIQQIQQMVPRMSELLEQFEDEGSASETGE